LHDLLFRLGNSGNGVSADMMELPQVCWQHLVPVKEPLVLISQVPRSGGTLLNELFDGHLECHAHPYELSIGPTKDKWPLLDLNDSPERWFDVLFEPSTVESFQRGYQKYGPGKDKNRETFRFLFLPSVQKELFLKYVTGLQITSPRQVFDAYMTSYFNAWLNNHNVEGDKKAVVAFTPWLATDKENVRRFFDVYPDGKLISILRSPQSWYVSARLTPAFETQMTDIVSAMRPWEESAQAMRRNKHKYGERVCLLSFENLVDKTEAVMRYLADYVGIKFDEILLTPTFNKCPIKANSSYKVKTYGVIHEPVTRHLEILTKAEIETIENLTGELYESVSKEVTQI
jgi:Sulfotransferase family